MMMPKILDNKKNKVVDELKKELEKGSKLSIVSAYFTIYAYAELKKELSNIDSMRFIFTEPTFIKKYMVISLAMLIAILFLIPLLYFKKSKSPFLS